MKIFVETLRKDSVTLEIEKADTIKKAKCVLKDKLVREEISVDDFDLEFAGKPMEDEKCLQDYSIKEGSKVHMAVRFSRESLILVKYQDPSKKKERFMIVEIGEADKRLDLKLKLKELTNVPPNKQSLLFHGEKVKEGSTILDLMGWNSSKNSIDKSDINNRTIIIMLGGDKKACNEARLNKCGCF